MFQIFQFHTIILVIIFHQTWWAKYMRQGAKHLSYPTLKRDFFNYNRSVVFLTICLPFVTNYENAFLEAYYSADVYSRDGRWPAILPVQARIDTLLLQ